MLGVNYGRVKKSCVISLVVLYLNSQENVIIENVLDRVMKIDYVFDLILDLLQENKANL